MEEDLGILSQASNVWAHGMEENIIEDYWPGITKDVVSDLKDKKWHIELDYNVIILYINIIYIYI